MNLAEIDRFVTRRWDEDIVARLIDYVRIPAKSPAFDASWEAHGHLKAVIQAAEQWSRAQPIAGLTLEIVALDGKTPCLFFDAPATGGLGNDRTVLFYGHLDKQPEMTGWRADLGPWKPVVEDGKLYGRGSGDDRAHDHEVPEERGIPSGDGQEKGRGEREPHASPPCGKAWKRHLIKPATALNKRQDC